MRFDGDHYSINRCACNLQQLLMNTYKGTGYVDASHKVLFGDEQLQALEHSALLPSRPTFVLDRPACQAIDRSVIINHRPSDCAYGVLSAKHDKERSWPRCNSLWFGEKVLRDDKWVSCRLIIEHDHRARFRRRPRSNTGRPRRPRC